MYPSLQLIGLRQASYLSVIYLLLEEVFIKTENKRFKATVKLSTRNCD